MKRKILVLGLIFICIQAMDLFAAPSSISVVFNGNTEVNRETFMFFRKVINQTAYDATFSALLPSGSIPAGTKGVIILNTGRPSGTDPALASFVTRYKGVVPMVMVNLFTNQSAVGLTLIPARSSETGIDTISTASLWGGGGRGRNQAGGGPGGSGSGPEAQHLVWFKKSLELLLGTLE